jgi:hypothetical protein
MTAASETPVKDPTAALRWSIYWVLIFVSTGALLGRILAVNSVDKAGLEKYVNDQGKKNNPDYKERQLQRPFLSGNDRSRWCTVRALVEYGTYSIDDITNQPGWDTIDMVKHDDFGMEAFEADKGHLYSSKPTLLPTLMAGEYWLITKITGKTLGANPYAIGRFMLITLNVLPMMIYLWIMGRLVERLGTSDWGRIFVMACACFGTFLTTFGVVINNHAPAAFCAAITLDAVIRIWYDGDRRWWRFAVAGFFAAFTAANELPALAFAVPIGVVLLLRAPRLTLLGFLPPVLLIAAAAVGTNYLAHHTVKPAYAFRSEGNNWYRYQFLRDGKVRDSYWMNPQARSPIDQGEPSKAEYVLHALVGHHGIFSLTPIWLLSFAGMVVLCCRRQPPLQMLGLFIAAVTVVCLIFYLALQNQENRNYGGMSSGFRWVFWFAPLWLVSMLPVADLASAKRWSRIACGILLCLSVMSAAYPTWNPWTQPWLFDILQHLDLVKLGFR